MMAERKKPKKPSPLSLQSSVEATDCPDELQPTVGSLAEYNFSLTIFNATLFSD